MMRAAAVSIVGASICLAAPVAAIPADFKARADAVLAASYESDEPGAAVVVTKAGQPVYAGARGLADLDAKRPLTANSVFRIGSITKQFTAAVILQLAEEGKLSLDDPLSKFLPDYPRPGADATVEQLLNHTSGIKSYTGIPGAMTEESKRQRLTTEQLIARFKDHPADFERGSSFRYNNSGYVLLGAIIEEVTGKPWHAAIEERISVPLGLTTIRYGAAEGQMPAMAAGYTADGEGSVKPPQAIDMSVPHAAGALLGSTLDLATWAHALHHGKIVQPESYARMIAQTKLSDGSTNNYGFGLSNSEVRGRKGIGHGGGISGFSTSSMYIPEEDMFIAVFANSDEPATDPDVVLQKIAAIAIGDPYPTFTEASVPAASLEPLFGTYRLEEGERIFFARDGKLYTRRSGGSDTQVYAAGDDRFFYGPNSLTWFRILRDPAGKHVMHMYHSGLDEPEPAVLAGPVPEQPAVASVAAEVLQSYVGDYDAPLGRVQIRMGGDERLTIQLGPQRPTALIPISDTEFRPESVDARVHFDVEDGKAKSLRLRQGGRELPAARVTGTD